MPLTKRIIVKRVVITLLVLFLLFIIALTVLQLYINNNKKSFIKLINDKLTEAVDGPVHLRDVDVDVWRHFPNVDISILDINIEDSLYKKSLLRAGRVATRINILKLLTNKVDIHNLFISDARIHLFKDKNGYSNKYLFSFNKKKSGNNNLNIDEIELNNTAIITEDAIKEKWFGIVFNYLHADIGNSGSVMDIELKEDAVIRGLGFNLRKGVFLKDKPVKAKWNLQFNKETKELSFDKTNVNIDGTRFVLNGSFFLKDSSSAHFKISASAKQLEYEKAKEIFTSNIQKKIGLVHLTQPFAVNATLEGPMEYKTIPRINVQWVVTENELVTPVADFKDCNFIGSFTNEKNTAYPRTDDNSEIVLAQFTGNWGGVALSGTNIIVTNLVHPILQFDLSSTTTLQALDNKLGLESISFLGGNASLALQYKGPLVADAAILSSVNGKLSIKDGLVKYTPRNLTFSNVNGDILFSQSDVLIKGLRCDLNTNHFKVDVAGINIANLVNNDPGKANILCKVYTPALNLDDFSALFSERTNYVRRKNKGTAKPIIVLDDALEKGTMEVDVTAASVKMKKFNAKNMNAVVVFRTNDWEIQKASLLHADGRVDLTAKVSELNQHYHRASMVVNLQHLNVKKLFYAFDNFGQDAVTSANLEGTIDLKANINVGLDNKGNLIPYSMDGYLTFLLKNGALINHEPLQRIQKFIFKNRDLSNVQFAELKDRFDIKNGNLYIHRMEIASSVLRIFVIGIYSLNPKNDATNISIQIPLNNLRKRPEDYVPEKEGNQASGGASIYLRARPNNQGEIKVGLDVFKKLRGTDIEEIMKDSLQKK